MPRDDGERSHTATSQRMSKTGKRQMIPLRVSERTWLCWPLDLELLAPRTGRQYISGVLNHPACYTLLRWPQATNTNFKNVNGGQLLYQSEVKSLWDLLCCIIWGGEIRISVSPETPSMEPHMSVSKDCARGLSPRRSANNLHSTEDKDAGTLVALASDGF